MIIPQIITNWPQQPHCSYCKGPCVLPKTQVQPPTSTSEAHQWPFLALNTQSSHGNASTSSGRTPCPYLLLSASSLIFSNTLLRSSGTVCVLLLLPAAPVPLGSQLLLHSSLSMNAAPRENFPQTRVELCVPWTRLYSPPIPC